MRERRIACQPGPVPESAPRLRGIRLRIHRAKDVLRPYRNRTNKPSDDPYLRPRLLILDELGYLPIDKTGADLLFQIISQRYERGSLAITTNRVFKHWPEIFNHDATLTSAVLDRLLHHAETVTVEGNSFRMKDVIDN